MKETERQQISDYIMFARFKNKLRSISLGMHEFTACAATCRRNTQAGGKQKVEKKKKKKRIKVEGEAE